MFSAEPTHTYGPSSRSIHALLHSTPLHSALLAPGWTRRVGRVCYVREDQPKSTDHASLTDKTSSPPEGRLLGLATTRDLVLSIRQNRLPMRPVIRSFWTCLGLGESGSCLFFPPLLSDRGRTGFDSGLASNESRGTFSSSARV